MPREIADSDDELDFVPRAKLTKSNIIQHVSTAGDAWNEDQLDPVLGTDFDQFLSPTQRLSSYDGNHESANDISTSRFLDSSTNRFLDAVAPSSNSPSQNIAYTTTASQSTDTDMGGKRSKEKPSTTGSSDKKRPRSEMEDGYTIAQDGQATKKRAKAKYGPASSFNTKSKDVSDFEAIMHDSRDDDAGEPHNHGNLDDDAGVHLPDMVSVDARTDYTSPLDLSLHLSPTDGVPITEAQKVRPGDIAAANHYVPPQPYRPQDSFRGGNIHGVTTSNSSMGNYQSFSINPEKLGMDFDKINPFGSLSQVSLPGDLDSEETRGIADIFRNSASYSTKAIAKGSGSSKNMVSDIERDMQTSPIKGDNEFNLRSRDRHDAENEAQSSPPFSQITNLDEQKTEHGASNSRGRSDKTPVEEANHSAAKPAPKKRGRKPKNAKKIDSSKPVEDEIDELQADEQPLDRGRRASTVDSASNVSEISHTTNSSKRGKKRKLKNFDMAPPELQSKKLPSSDLGLDNKAVIGLSPERYVPRPSRRRGQVEQHSTESSEIYNSAAGDPAASIEEVSTNASPAKGKKGRKGKRKGAKATAVAVARQQEDLHADGARADFDEVFPTEEPSTNATPQAQLHSELDDRLKDEKDVADEDEDNDEVVTRGVSPRTKISVNIPVFAKPDEGEDLLPPIAEPKKRGRKRKKPLEEASVESDKDAKARTALSEKDANIQIDKSKSEEPLDANGDQQEDQNTKPDKQDEEVEEFKEKDLTSADKTDTAAKTSSTPIKPVSTPNSTSKTLSSTSLFNVRARIGLSKRHSIPSLLRKVDRNKEAPKNIERKEKVTKRVLEEREQERIAREEAEAEGREYKPLDQLRDKDGRLVEWDF